MVTAEALPLQLIRDELAIDRTLGTPEGVRQQLSPLAAVALAGFGVHAGVMFLLGASQPEADLVELGLRAVAWGLSAAGGYLAAILAGLPSYWFYGLVAGLQAPAWRLAAEVLRVQAVGSVVLLAVLPPWLALTLALGLLGAPLHPGSGWWGLSLLLPFAAPLPGMFGLVRAFYRMGAAQQRPGWGRPLLLAGAWMGLFFWLAPLTVFRLHSVLLAAWLG